MADSSLKTLFASAPRRAIKETFGSNGTGLEVEMLTVPKSELEDLVRRINRKVRERNPDGSAEWKSTVDRDKLHRWILEHILSLEGMTVGKVLGLCNRLVPAEHAADRDRVITWDPADEGCRDTVLFMLKDARIEIDGVTQSFEDFVWQHVSKAAEESHAAEVEAKND